MGWVGLFIAIFLIVAGITGSALVFYDELDTAINPDLYDVTPPSNKMRPLDPLVIRERLIERHPSFNINWIKLNIKDEHALRIKVRLKEGVTHQVEPLAFDEIFVNPYTAEILGTRMWGDISDGVENLIPFLYKLHYKLALGRFGKILMGVVSLLWTIDCFIGAYLTFPRKSKRKTEKKFQVIKHQFVMFKLWLQRWKQAWTLRWKRMNYRFNFDFHSAAGLWAWGILFVLAWSGTAFNLPQVYQPAMEFIFDFQNSRESLTRLPEPNHNPKFNYKEARKTALEYLRTTQSRPESERIFQIEPIGMRYIADLGVYYYRFKSNRDIQDDSGKTALFIDANTGKIKAFYLPTGKSTGDTITTWIKSLHMAAVWGLPFKIFVCVMGFIVAMLAISGVIIWWRKHSARQKSHNRRFHLTTV